MNISCTRKGVKKNKNLVQPYPEKAVLEVLVEMRETGKTRRRRVMK